METILGLVIASAVDTLLVLIASLVLWNFFKTEIWRKYYQEGFDDAQKHYKKEINRLKKLIGEEE